MAEYGADVSFLGKAAMKMKYKYIGFVKFPLLNNYIEDTLLKGITTIPVMPLQTQNQLLVVVSFPSFMSCRT